MSQAAQARDSWADTPIRRSRPEPDSWASAEDLEILGGLGEERVADWTVLTIERDESPADAGVPASDNVVRLDRGRRGRFAQRDVAAAEPASEAPTLSHLTDPALAAAPAAIRAPAIDTPPEPLGAIDGAAGGRRTVVIRGQATPPRAASTDRRRPAPRTRDRVGHRPDRVAMWAVMLGLLLIVVATMTAG
jgi:hypothetical protein